MKAKRGRVVLGLVLIAVAFLCVQMAYGFLDVQVVKNDTGVEKLVFKPAPDFEPIAQGPVQRRTPYFLPYYDWSGDGMPDVFACGENQDTGLVKCQSRDSITNVQLANFNLLTPEYSVSVYPYLVDINGDGKYELAACGIKFSDNSVWCQMKNPANGANIGSIFQVAPAGIVYEDGFSMTTYLNVDGNPDTREMGVCWRKASNQQVYCRVYDSGTHAAMTPEMPVLSRNYDMSPSTPDFGDVNGDGKSELYAIARNRATGLTVWQVKTGETGALIKNVSLMSASDYVTNRQIGQYEAASAAYEMMACGWNTATKQPWCEIKRLDNTVFKTITPILGPGYVP